MTIQSNGLYTINKWNTPLVTQAMNRGYLNTSKNLFSNTLNTSLNGGGFSLNKDRFSLSNPYGLYTNSQLSQPSTQMPVNWGDGVQRSKALGDINSLVDNFGKVSSSNNQFSQILGKGSGSGGSGAGWAAAGQAAATTLLNTPMGDKAMDVMDPVWHLAGGRESAVGNTLSTAGKSLLKSSAASGNGYMALAAAGLKVLGGLTNAAWGIKTDQRAVDEANRGIDYYSNYKSDASSFDDVEAPLYMGSFNNPYKGGWFTGGKARRKNEELRDKFMAAESYANRSYQNNINNIANTQMGDLMKNYNEAAFGGPLGSQGAIDYGLMSDYLTMRNKATSVKDKISTNPFGSLPITPTGTFALGGDIQTNGSDFFTGLSMVNAGGSHEQNPYGGVQVGISRDNGEPNLVEEGETIFDDYVFSKRIKVDKKTKDRFHLGKKANMSYADVSKKLQKESEERPNDVISQRGFTKQMHDLADEQERQKSEMQQKQAKDMFDSLPPEQQAEIMQQLANEQQQPQEQPMQGQPTDQQMIDNQMQQQREVPVVDNGEQINACGGKMNRFDKGGDMKSKIYNLLNLHTDSDFNNWLGKRRLAKIDDWDNILKNGEFIQALKEENPVVADAISRGYDFGNYVPKANNNLTFDFVHGGWGKEDYNAWNGSTDAAWQEAVKKGLVKEGMNSEEIGNALKQTDAYRRGTDWLKADENNRLAYLQQIYNSKDAPEAARAFAGKYVDANGWIKDAKRDYQTIFEDPNGTGVRNTHPGTYWKTPNEILRDSQTNNYVVNDDGTVEQIVGNVPKDWTSAGNYSWADDKSDYTANYYKRPVTTDANNNKGNEEETLEPVHKSTLGRTLGLFGPMVGLGMQMTGIGKPDYSRLDSSLDIMNGAPSKAHYKPIGNYLTYNPMDIWYEQNRMDANSKATDRAITNSASPTGTKMAGLLANGYNSQIASGDLFRKALEYNDAQRQKVAEFNRGTDMYNADAFTRTSATNAQIENSNRQARASLAMDAARQRMAADAAWNQGIYGNVNSFFQGLGAWGKENEQHNMIANMAADGIFGNMSDKQNIGKGYLIRRVKKASKGGKLNRKRGLTF